VRLILLAFVIHSLLDYCSIDSLFVLKAQVHQNRCMATKEHAQDSFSTQLQRTIHLNSKPEASSWLLALPLQDQGLHLTKQEFWDTLHLRYG